MELNIALNTIVYLMIFIFPGILFRKFLFRNEYSKEFDEGNLFERTVWIIFTSTCMLFIVASLFITLNRVFNADFLSYIRYDTIRKRFSELSDNKLPDPTQKDSADFTFLKDFFFLMLAIYIFSALFGWISYYLVKSPLYRKIGVFRFKNYWQDLIVGTNYKNKSDNFIYGYTLADVLVDVGSENKLYSGTVKDYFISPDNLQIQTLVLTKVKRYTKNKTTDTVELKDVPGDNFILEKEKILNYNFTYILVEKKQMPLYRFIFTAIDTLTVICIILLFSCLFINNVSPYLSTITRKIAFIIFGLSLLGVLNSQLKYILSGEWSQLKIEDIFAVIFLALPFVWIFNIVTWLIALLMMVGCLFLFAVILTKKEEKNSQKAGKDKDIQAFNTSHKPE